jgi:hypothetical protein
MAHPDYRETQFRFRKCGYLFCVLLYYIKVKSFLYISKV